MKQRGKRGAIVGEEEGHVGRFDDCPSRQTQLPSGTKPTGRANAITRVLHKTLISFNRR